MSNIQPPQANNSEEQNYLIIRHNLQIGSNILCLNSLSYAIKHSFILTIISSLFQNGLPKKVVLFLGIASTTITSSSFQNGFPKSWFIFGNRWRPIRVR